ncbi:MAG: hypothetical protein AB7G44_11100 [Bacteroidia bacterium]
MKPTDTLFQLVKSMSREENKFFRKHYCNKTDEKSSLHIQIFNRLCKMDNYDEQALKKGINPSVFKTLKNRMKDDVLDCLCIISPPGDVNELRRKLSHAEMLSHRGLFNEAESMLNTLAEKIEKNSLASGSAYLHQVLTAYSHILQRQENAHLDKATENLGKRIVKNAETLAYSMKFYYGYLRLAKIQAVNPHLRTDEQLLELSELVDTFSISNLPLHNSFDQNIYYKLSGSLIDFLIGSFSRHFQLEQELFEEIYSNKEVVERREIPMFAYAFSGFANACFKIRDVKKMRYAVDKATPVYEKYFINDLRLYGDYAYLCCALDYLEGKKIKQNADLLKTFFETNFEKLNHDVRIFISYILMLSYHKTGDYAQALHFNTSTLDINPKIDSSKDFREFSRLYYLLILVDRENSKTLPDFINIETQVAAFKNYVYKNYANADHQLETLFISFFESLLKINNKKQVKLKFEKLSVNLKQLEKQDIQYIRHMFSKFDFLKWSEQSFS